MHYLTSCSIVKDEDDYIDDFVKIHRYLGVEHFIFYDRSKNLLSERFKNEKDMTIINFPEPNRHADAWLHCVKNFPTLSKWTAFFDIDMVLTPVKTNDVREVLKDYENYGGVAYNWHTYGSSGQKEKTSGSLYERFLMRAENNDGINNHIQTVAQIPKVAPSKPSDPHHLHMQQGEIYVNENFRQIYKSPFSVPPSQNKMFFSHFLTKSLFEFKEKCQKSRADTGEIVPYSDFDKYDKNINAVKDTRVLDLWNAANAKV